MLGRCSSQDVANTVWGVAHIQQQHRQLAQQQLRSAEVCGGEQPERWRQQQEQEQEEQQHQQPQQQQEEQEALMSCSCWRRGLWR